MSQREIKVRVRPHRICTVVSEGCTFHDLDLVFHFYSRLWGGRYCQILQERHAGDEWIARELANQRPDLVYGVGVDLPRLGTICSESCQPRGWGELSWEFAKGFDLQPNLVSFIHARHIVHWLVRNSSSRFGMPNQFVIINGEDPLQSIALAAFGRSDPDLTGFFPCEPTLCVDPATTPLDFLKILRVYATSWHRHWLHLVNHGLNATIYAFPPNMEIVAIEKPGDIVLYWNRRAASAEDLPETVLPIPAEAFEDEGCKTELVEILGQMHKGFIDDGGRVCLVSQTIGADRLQRWADDLTVRIKCLGNQRLKSVYLGGDREKQIIPVVPHESELRIACEFRNNHLIWTPPRPQFASSLDQDDCWIVDIEKDVETNRALCMLELPGRSSTMEVLNAPSPESFRMYRLPTAGFGFDSINFRCSNSYERRSDCLPTAEEIIHEMLTESAVTPIKDEKRECYEEAFRLFENPSIRESAKVFSGVRGQIVRALALQNMTCGDLLGKLKLGKGKLKELQRPSPYHGIHTPKPGATGNISGKRWTRWLDREYPSDTKLQTLLEFWVSKGLVSRSWKIGPCLKCRSEFWERQLALDSKTYCQGCASFVEFKSNVPYGYSLNPALKSAVLEGLIPIALTARLLEHECSRGFLWLPGVKYIRGEQKGDIDIAAICDRRLVLCECKDLSDADELSAAWNEVGKQLVALIEIGIQCRADVVLLAVLAKSIPQRIQQLALQRSNGKIKVVFLTNTDLEAGKPAKAAGNILRITESADE